MKSAEFKRIKLQGQTGKLLEGIVDNWLIGLRNTNPAILDMFADRDYKPYRDLLPWSGEFAGKYITGAYYVYKLTGRRDLYDYINSFIDEMIGYQDRDGYLGCYSKECHLSGSFSQNPTHIGVTWDSWNHYHIMYGLLLWYDLTKKGSYLQTVEKIAELYLGKFYNGKPSLVSIGSSEMNLAVYHIFGLLYARTREMKYLEFAQNVEKDLSDENAGNYIYYSEQGYEFYQCPKPRWESIHVIMGIAQMYRNTGEERYLAAAKQIFFSILKTDVHNTGGFSTNEQAIGNPYKNEIIETCCVIAYNALAIDLYELTGDCKIIDFLERSHYNAVLGYYSPTGRWSTYNTPMEGSKCANYHSINFQCRPGSPELNCCSVNAPRGVANFSEWMLCEKSDCLYLNFYEAMSFETADGVSFELIGDYPASDKVRIRINSGKQKKKIAFRIPSWSKNTVISIEGENFVMQKPGYFKQSRVWDCEITVSFDFTPRTEAGECDLEGKVSVFAGPVLYGIDLHDEPTADFENTPEISAAALSSSRPTRKADGSIRLELAGGPSLKDFYHLGESGSTYRTWLVLK